MKEVKKVEKELEDEEEGKENLLGFFVYQQFFCFNGVKLKLD